MSVVDNRSEAKEKKKLSREGRCQKVSNVQTRASPDRLLTIVAETLEKERDGRKVKEIVEEGV